MSGASESSLRACRSCAPAPALTQEEIAGIFHGLTVREVKLADRTEYERRLGICRSCPDCLAGTTCRHCGCLIAVRTKIRAVACPAPEGALW